MFFVIHQHKNDLLGTNPHKIRSFWPQNTISPRSFWVQFSVAHGTPPAIFGPSTPPRDWGTELLRNTWKISNIITPNWKSTGISKIHPKKYKFCWTYHGDYHACWWPTRTCKEPRHHQQVYVFLEYFGHSQMRVNSIDDITHMNSFKCGTFRYIHPANGPWKFWHMPRPLRHASNLCYCVVLCELLTFVAVKRRRENRAGISYETWQICEVLTGNRS